MLNKLIIFYTSIYFCHARQISSAEFSSIQENYILPNHDILLHFGIFCFLMLLFIYPPESVVGIGFTLENFISSYCGNPDPDIVQYQSRRIVVNRTFVGALPFLFCLYLFLSQEHALVFAIQPTRLIHYFANLSLPILLGACTYWSYHHMTGFRELTAVKQLSHYGSNLHLLYTSIASEIVQLETFKHNISSSSRIIISNTWLIFYSKFNFCVYKVADVAFSVTNAEEIFVNPLNPEGAIQLITLQISVPPHLGSDIVLKIHNLTLRDLQSTLIRPISIPPNIVLKLSTVERFAKAFSEEAAKNQPYYVDNVQDLEPCLACSETKSNMKLVRTCAEIPREPGTQQCQRCMCRPMWCVLCMAKIFAAKQDQNRPEQWLTGVAPCPTCRSIFCIFDVALVQVRSSAQAPATD